MHFSRHEKQLIYVIHSLEASTLSVSNKFTLLTHPQLFIVYVYNLSPKQQKMLPTELQQFDEVFPELVCGLTEKGFPQDDLTDAMTWFRRVCNHLLYPNPC